ncbi:hypothetical protein BegalDRAFT_0518 [Beggiatoa alba B18LD]|uniref:Uncharacterized protein n=1 Tax=Beggiatoa alba B18LD TaxID=395493 RepID=I3CCU3_9GAMM|nr:DUF1028 domain-containing protein [Beggiatoa alba]EIJ41436.1 hypothetical protein BegalDRAFT_0518 [Beggiatoa alba B18LD]
MYLSTFSIVARCPQTHMLGIAMCTAIPAIGGLALHLQAQVGAIATQAKLNPYLGKLGLAQLATGLKADAVLQQLRLYDPAFETRQISIVDAQGNTAVHTGQACFTWCGHRQGEGYVIAANMMQDVQTVEAMETAFLKADDLPFAERLLMALIAGDKTGGDYRGRQSACLQLVQKEAYPYLDIRVDEHQTPVAELARIYQVCQQQLLPLMPLLPTQDNPAGCMPPAEHPYFTLMRKPVIERGK